jgi:hypothetical protein
MRRLKGRRPSPAMTVAGAALIIALAGTAMAAPTALKSVLDKKEKKQVKNIANKQINKRAPGLSVANAQNAGNADTLDGKHASQLQTSSAYAERTVDLPLAATFQDVVTTSVTTTGTRIVANASLELDSGVSSTVHCRLQIAGAQSFTYDEQALPTEAAMALTFARTVPAGTHAVGLECSETGVVIADDASLSVVAVGE